METRSLDELSGYRKPTREELNAVADYFSKKATKSTKGIKTILAIFMMILLIMGFMVYFSSAHIGKWLFIFAGTIMAAKLLRGLNRKKESNASIMEMANEGKYVVLDVYSDDFYSIGGISGNMVAYLVTFSDESGMYLDDPYEIEGKWFSKYRGQEKVPMLLIYDKESHYSDVFIKEEIGL